MNQAIQFPDREEWNVITRKVHFPVLINGMLAECTVSESLLHKRYSLNVEAISLFQDNRWDIEEEFEVLIKQDPDQESGTYSLPEDK
ncbi:DUF1488 domain-containing protein [Providencia burhodogranariea]|uniref:DUF1488 domain-containing protein n=1 Tax=Providencia burhodogranariea DSM 19968 TaxID=1141662 RepID=K8W624_9GAMM|nr:DUF1488 domain-containing protein [Providencia burhodogranariea]EKT52892.1 hypothetical protein OOA_19801 [Providencia burhodogranariea DSM 19968]